MKKHNAQRGFTLMELMVVIVIVAILAAVAVPLYINYVNDAKRTEAKGAIGAVITGEQVYFQEHATYTPDMSLLKVDLTDVTPRWTITVPSGDAAGFTVHAVSADGSLTQDYTYVRATGAATWTP